MPPDQNASTETTESATSELDQAAIDAGLIDAVEQNTTAEVVSGKPGDSGEPAASPASVDEKKDEPKTVLEAVKRAQEERKAKAEKPAEPEKRDPGAEAKAEQADDKDGKNDRLTREEWKNLSDRAKRRIGTLAGEVKTLNDRMAALEPKAQTLDSLTGYIRTSGMTQQEFTDGLEIMRLRKQDPARAYAALKPIMDELAAYVGDALPQDLQQDVEDGRITQEAAKQLVAERNRAGLLENQLAAQREQQANYAATQQVSQEQQEIHRAISDMEASWKRSDPDYALKQHEVLERVVFLLQSQGVPQGRDAILKMVQGAKKTIDERVASRQPKRQLSPVNTQGAANTASRDPKSSVEAAALTLAKMRQRA